ncbi:MAG: hypothetical protein M1813_003732 [Trichoglossum hirsutum]|nr:MAG: hypothetical protein M1813_003732 [Trichoglossum hirsutum]
MSTATLRQQPPWHAPSGVVSRLTVYNSLTRIKNHFVPLDSRGKEVTWYCCGPTVYDAGHLGHARNYISTDILRRIMRDYFGYDVLFVMNITDVDDKIIVRARQEHFLAEFKQKHSCITDPVVLDTALSAFHAYASKNLPLLRKDTQPDSYERESRSAYNTILEGGTIAGHGTPGDNEAKLKMHIKTLSSASKAIVIAKENPSSISDDEFYGQTGDVLQQYLDSLYGSSIDPEEYGIFAKLTQHWERHFNEDIRSLNCLPPDIVTRVSEYIPENVAFVERIVNNGFAYKTPDGSVYFDIKAFEAAGNNYARLEPWNRNDKELLADGEGSLAKKSGIEKRSDADFALWKSSKPGEPSWPSPWGRGRPGWHIECSAMSSKVLGRQMDIHSGGIDLAFPHHDNEIAQSEAYWTENAPNCTSRTCQNRQWVNYFLHMGHLSISGSKMSKSLKNFTTIRTALEKQWTARGLRIVFLMGGWKERIEVTDDVVSAARTWEATVNKFFANVGALIAEQEGAFESGAVIPQPFREEEHQLWEQLREAKAKLDDALCDSFNTPAAMGTLSDLISKANIYISAGRKTHLGLAAIKGVARWVTRIVGIFGLVASLPGPDGGDRIGWGSGSSVGGLGQDGTGSLTTRDITHRYLQPFSTFRDRMRKLAAFHKDSPIALEILKICDITREDLRTVDVYFEDQFPSHRSFVRFAPKDGAKIFPDSQATALRFVRPFSVFRDKMRQLAIKNSKSDAITKDILLECDSVRDNDLTNLGIYLDDRDAGQPALIKFIPREQLIADRVERLAKAAEVARKREEARLERERLERDKAERGRLSHLEMFRTSEYKEWDEEGIPVRDASGEEITKSRGKKLRKDWERQKKLHEEWSKRESHGE